MDPAHDPAASLHLAVRGSPEGGNVPHFCPGLGVGHSPSGQMDLPLLLGTQHSCLRNE